MISSPASTVTAAERSIRWETLPSIPDREGFAGSFAGVHQGALIVAGGANFPDKRPWEGGRKIWYDSVFVMEKPGGRWKTGFKLPRPLGYGVSISHPSGLICVGGSDANGHSAEVFALSWSHGQITATELPRLPQPCANMCGVLLDNTIYIAGGIERPDSTNALKTFWSLDLAHSSNGWKELEAWPGPGRMLAVSGAADGAFFLFGGAGLTADADQKPVREWLRDGFRYDPKEGWRKIADLPHSVVAAPSPAPIVDHQLLVLGGDDGEQVKVVPTEHHGFSRDLLAYDPRRDQWRVAATLPFALVTTPSVTWNKRIVVPGGEARPGVRSTEVWASAKDF